MVNTTVSRFVYAKVEASRADSLFRSIDLGVSEALTPRSQVANFALPLHLATFNYVKSLVGDRLKENVQLTSFTEAPVGSGLGTSSALVVAMLSALAHHFELHLSKQDVASAAVYIEREVCKFPGGRQDAYAASHGGLNFFNFQSSAASVEPLDVPESLLFELEQHIAIFDLGVSRLSSSIISDQMAVVSNPESPGFEALCEIRDSAEEMRLSLLRADFADFVRILSEGWRLKKITSNLVSSREINEIVEAGFSAGAGAGKISGAGGGGHLFFLVPPEKRRVLIESMHEYGAKYVPTSLSEEGVQSWKSRQ